MAILNILKDTDPTLRKTSREVGEITPRILTLLDDMKDTMRAANGCGLAAVQSRHIKSAGNCQIRAGAGFSLSKLEYAALPCCNGLSHGNGDAIQHSAHVRTNNGKHICAGKLEFAA